jgi:hypothetical protein
MRSTTGERPFLLICNPENRRASAFQEALAEAGFGPATVISWLSLAEDPSVLEAVDLAEAIVRIDSAGENFEVERAFLRLGWEKVRAISPERIAELSYDRGRILAPRQAHEGFLSVLRSFAPIFAARPGWRVLSPLEEIEVMFDKRLTSKRYRALGLPVPPSFDEIGSAEQLAEEMERRKVESVFVKLSCSSSASCLAIYTRSNGRDSMLTTIEQAKTGWYNTLKVRRLDDARAIREILTVLIRDGSQIEEAIDKATLDGAIFDCRVVVIDGDPEFVVVRQNRHPITNLHLGGWRGSLESLEREAGPALAEGLESCRRAAESHRSFSVGVDLMFERGFSGHRLLESNAFGDLLPNLTKSGKSVYARLIEKVMR